MNSLLRQLIFLLCLGLSLAAPAADSGFTIDKNASGNKSALSLFSDQEEEFLSPDQAFQVEVEVVDSQTIRASYRIAPGYYLYKSRIQFSVKDRPEAAKVVSVQLPAGEMKDDPNFGRQEVYHHDFKAEVKLASNSPQLNIETGYQGCSDKGLCYAPIKKRFDIDLGKPSPSNSGSNTVTADDELTTGLLKGGNLWLIVGGFFIAGLLLSLTPCVLPMIPILSSIIVGHQTAQRTTLSTPQAVSKLHGFALSVAYVLGMALSYTLAGIAAGLSGNLLSQSLQNAWVLGSFAGVFVLLACAMFGLYELRLPQRFEDKLLNVSNRLKGGKFLGVFAMGALSALIVSPCVAAPLAGALIYIGQSQDVVLGGIALFALSLGMGVPLLIIGASAGSILPKTGSWMNVVRNLFGIVLLAMAIWLISPVIPRSFLLGLWAALAILTAIFAKALDTLPAKAGARAKLGKGLAIILLVWGISLLVGAFSGASSIWQPLGTLSTNQGTPASRLTFKRIANVADLQSAIQQAPGQAVMLDFYADWCVACKEMEAFTFSERQIQQRLENTLLLQADVTANSADDVALLKHFGLYGPPGIIFFNRQGVEITQARVIGFQDVAKFTKTLDKRDQYL